jgi:hypothetical protein
MGHFTLFVERQRGGIFCCNTLEAIQNIRGVPLMGVQQVQEDKLPKWQQHQHFVGLSNILAFLLCVLFGG